MQRLIKIVAVVAMLALVAAACGEGDDEEPTATGETAGGETAATGAEGPLAEFGESTDADPANVYLNSYLAETRRRKLELLRRATALVDQSSAM